jgi:F-type H+-transporting ATPase subunit delta
LFRASLTNGSLDSQKVAAVTDSVISSKPRQYVGVLKEYARLIRLELAKHHAAVTSAVELSETERESVMSALRSRFQSELTFDFTTDSALIGGLCVQVGSDVWDSSVRTRLARLAAEFSR